MRQKYPWIDKEKYTRSPDCPAAKSCEAGALSPPAPVGEGGDGEVGYTPPSVDLEKCKQCGDCSFACDEGAVKML